MSAWLSVGRTACIPVSVFYIPNILMLIIILAYGQNGQQIRSVSWWPSPHIWNKSSSWLGWWSPWNESWYQRRIADILDLKQSPKNNQKWKHGDWSGGSDKGIGRKVASFVDEHSAQFLDAHYICS